MRFPLPLQLNEPFRLGVRRNRSQQLLPLSGLPLDLGPGGLGRPSSASRLSARTPRRGSRRKTWLFAVGLALFGSLLLLLVLRRVGASPAAEDVGAKAATTAAGATGTTAARLVPAFAGVDVTIRDDEAGHRVERKGDEEGSEGELVELRREDAEALEAAKAAGADGAEKAAGEGSAREATSGVSEQEQQAQQAATQKKREDDDQHQHQHHQNHHHDGIVGSRALDPGHDFAGEVVADDESGSAKAVGGMDTAARVALERARARSATKSRASLDAIARATGGRVSAYDPPIPLVDASGRRFTTARFKGRVLLVVNVASQCGYTESNYAGLTRLLERYGAYGLDVLAFPCDQFGHQEPDDADRIEESMHRRFPGSDFVFAAKGDVNGPRENELFAFLKRATPNAEGALELKDISWNFNKFLLDRHGIPVRRYTSSLDYNQLERDVYELLVQGESAAQA